MCCNGNMCQVQAAEHCILLILTSLPQLKSDHQSCSNKRFKIPNSQMIKVNSNKKEMYLKPFQCSQYFSELPCYNLPHLSVPWYDLLLLFPTGDTTGSEPCLTSNKYTDFTLIAHITDSPLLRTASPIVHECHTQHLK